MHFPPQPQSLYFHVYTVCMLRFPRAAILRTTTKPRDSENKEVKTGNYLLAFVCV